MEEVHKAYIAGYFDADGCITAGFAGHMRSKNIRVAARISGRDGAMLEELEYVYGGSLTHSGSGRGEDYPIWIWALSGRNTIIPFLKDVLPYLRLKKEQAELALEIARTIGEVAQIPALGVKVYRARLALKICHLNQANLSNPRGTKTIERLEEIVNESEEK